MTQCRRDVEYTARKLIAFLKEEKGIDTRIDETSYRDYCVSVDIESWNSRLTLWYSPKRKSSKISVIRCENPETQDRIHMIWHEFIHGDILKNGDIHAFVDGSYINGKIGYGAVILKKGIVLHEFSGQINRPEYLQHYQVSGELAGVSKVFQWCIENNISRCTIHYDYEGIKKWATGEWKANKELTQKYQQYVSELPLDISWVKVKSHSGNLWNEQADRLAREAIKGKGSHGRIQQK
jgi:ribonuclease HI